MPDKMQTKDRPTLNEYTNLLQSEWTRPVACQDQCDPPESCSCQRRIVHVDAIKAWCGRKASGTSEQTKLHRLFDEMQSAGHRKFPLDFKTFFTGEYHCLRVFGRLLEQGYGNLIDRFYNSNMHDIYLERGEEYQQLRENLLEIFDVNEVDRIIQDFQHTRWAYCPFALTLHVDRGLESTKVIVPFCRKIKLGDKGGTASVYWVAIQRDLISDEGLKGVLHESLHLDPDFGECYQLALKSYCGNKKLAYEQEKDAFSGLKSNERVPIVRYLGSYTHDHGEGYDSKGVHTGKTYNLLLEYGEQDLYQYWADETNVPPVRADEIVREWESLFEVADAIRHVHNLEVPRERGDPWRFYGWHADIKPDNILIVHGRFKLADFGYSRFAPVVKSQDGVLPTEFINGFTDTYGAPEVSRMKRPDGTMSGVTQSIDTWSFGCVLSVAATWIVLGFQGVRQYEILRTLAPANNRDGAMRDCFHDGTQVLPEIRKWHNYLRGHLRPSDTTTPLVLDLIEHKMLQTDTYNRLELGALCDELKDLIPRAKEKIRCLKLHARETDPVVLQALLKVEQEAQRDKSSRPKSTPFQQQTTVAGMAHTSHPLQRVTRHLQKEHIIKSKPLGQTTYRKEILEKQLKRNSVIREDDEQNKQGTHNGAVTDSPIESLLPADTWRALRKEKPRNPEHPPATVKLAKPAPIEFRDAVSTATFQSSSQPRNHSSNSNRFVANGGNPGSNEGQPSSFDALRNSAESVRSNRQTSMAPDSPLARKSTYPAVPEFPQGSSLMSPESHRSTPDVLSPLLYTSGSKDTSPVSPYPPTVIASAKLTQSRGSSVEENSQQRRLYSDNVPQLSYPIPNRSNSNDRRIYEPDIYTSGQIESSPIPGPSIILSQPAEPVASEQSTTDFFPGLHVAEKQAVDPEQDIFSPESIATIPLPPSVYDLPFNICHKRKELDQQVSKGFAKLKGKFGVETRNKDTSLVQTFSEPREIILVVDNGGTMFEHWPIVMFVAETLAKNAAGLDKNGICHDMGVMICIHRFCRAKLAAG
ncbi:uncharacterized protein K460DRAFT_26715 [Cucurbitaria berberidis CBS 394.84]|uniref:Protein kinase domain-containing protein n=1 Tax=Cucurbitaria berberidis CBS 394.84 TaxID=1168544 RepID=A0A9P4LDP2_9PLEO|nr:uncharacterized protein K460DRAFT_26715 [Cucurbitaria berberidis CBS 394.84]KAF1851033.1 hypothetical protein K460DRAFT_26715 [Cucurbitaria berberidis CBS 394.84]